MTVKVCNYVFVGSDADLANLKTTPAVLHAAKEPYHREFVGYTTPGAPKESHEYLYAMRGDEMALNLIDVPNPLFVPFELMDKAVNFINYFRARQRNIFIHCNQGRSRAPTLALLAMAPSLDGDFETAVNQFVNRYTNYQPGFGVYYFAKENWRYFHADK